MAWIHFTIGTLAAALLALDMLLGWLSGEPQTLLQGLLILVALVLAAVATVALRVGVLTAALVAERRDP